MTRARSFCVRKFPGTELPYASLIGIEAGMATHYMSRDLVALGHEVKQVPPAYAKPFRQGHKNDFRDAALGIVGANLSIAPVRGW